MSVRRSTSAFTVATRRCRRGSALRGWSSRMTRIRWSRWREFEPEAEERRGPLPQAPPLIAAEPPVAEWVKAVPGRPGDFRTQAAVEGRDIPLVPLPPAPPRVCRVLGAGGEDGGLRAAHLLYRRSPGRRWSTNLSAGGASAIPRRSERTAATRRGRASGPCPCLEPVDLRRSGVIPLTPRAGSHLYRPTAHPCHASP
jgi:hypothetical protein